ncbi:MAG: helix-turn-helix transcriptional regulator [Oscillospiraceae bacterium]|nr:helix-turn-helix transcriptional regulator [Oscillospiraceae bacterium]
MKSIGEKIKKYRQKNHMTQEQLASFLNITFQTVSKWETGVSSPDLSLIIPITKIFHISADELLGVNDVESDKRYDELNQAYKHTFRTEDFEERQRICELAVSEYPGDMEWLYNLASVISNRSFEHEDHNRYVAEQEKAIKLFDAVVKNCKNDTIRGYAISGITQLLGWRGRKDEARKYIELLPEQAATSREDVLENILDGDELTLFRQKRIRRYLECILWELSLMPTVYTDLMQDIVNVMIPDSNYIEFNGTLYYAIKRKINYIMKNDPSISAGHILDLLAEMQSYAKAYDAIVFSKPGVYKYTAPLFDHIEEDTREWFGSEGVPITKDFQEYLEDPQFDKLRNQESFEMLKNNA